jgi:hypothetical protein
MFTLQTIRLVITPMTQAQSTVGERNRETPMRLRSLRIRRVRSTRSTDGSTTIVTPMKQSTGLMGMAMFINAIDGKLRVERLTRLFTSPKRMEQ